MEVIENEIVTFISCQVNNEMMDRSILQQRGQNVLTSEKIKLFTAVAVAADSQTILSYLLQRKNAYLMI